jgi:HSP20 family protein
MAGYTWDPFEELRRIQQRMGGIFGEMPEELLPERLSGRMLTEIPNVDIIEKGNDVIVTADMPGVDKNDIKINVRDNNILDISAQKQTEEEEKEKGFIRHERAYKRYYRSIMLPVPVDKAKAKATYNNGVLEIILPMTEAAKESNIPIT